MRWLGVLLGMTLAGCTTIEVRGRALPRALAVDPADIGEAPTGVPTRAVQSFTAAGLPAVLVRDPGSELVSLQWAVGCGRVDDPPERAGLTEVMLQAMLTGGAGERSTSEQQLAQARLVHFDLAIDDAESWLMVTVRREELKEALVLLAEVFRSPRFDEAALARLTRTGGKILEEPDILARDWARTVRQRSLFGEASPLSRRSTPQSFSSIRREDVVAQHRRCVQPAFLSLGVAGDVDEATVAAALAPLEGWVGGAPRERHLAPDVVGGSHVYVVPTPVGGRVQVEVVSVGLRPGSEQRAAAWVMASAMTGELFYALRQRGGMIYDVTVDVEVGPTTGMTLIRFGTRREHAWVATSETLKALRSWWQHWPLTDEDLEKYIDRVATHWSRRSAAGLALSAAVARLQGGPPVTVEALRAVKGWEVREVFSNTLRPDRLQVIVSGPLSETDDWAALGPLLRAPAPSSPR